MMLFLQLSREQEMKKGEEKNMRQKDRFRVLAVEGNALGRGCRQVLVDSETGVQYLFIQWGYAGGLTVVVDADGKPLLADPGPSGTQNDF